MICYLSICIVTTWVLRERQRGLITLEVQGCSAPLEQSKTLVITMKMPFIKTYNSLAPFLPKHYSKTRKNYFTLIGPRSIKYWAITLYNLGHH